MAENATRGPLCRPYYGGKASKSPHEATKLNKRPGHVIFWKEIRRISAREKAPSWRFLAARSQIHAIGPHYGVFCQRRKECVLRQASIRRARRTFREVREVPYAEQGTPFGGLPYGEQDPLSQQAPYAERNARLRQASICQAGRRQPPEHRLTARTCVSCRIDAMFA